VSTPSPILISASSSSAAFASAHTTSQRTATVPVPNWDVTLPTNRYQVKIVFCLVEQIRLHFIAQKSRFPTCTIVRSHGFTEIATVSTMRKIPCGPQKFRTQL
jgi:hypothetical protein